MSNIQENNTESLNNEEKQQETKQIFHPYHQIKREPSHR